MKISVTGMNAAGAHATATVELPVDIPTENLQEAINAIAAGMGMGFQQEMNPGGGNAEFEPEGLGRRKSGMRGK